MAVGGCFTVHRDGEGEQLGGGTKVLVAIKEDEREYVGEECRLKDLMKKHSEFINYLISLWGETTTDNEVSLWLWCRAVHYSSPRE
mmetsp:Transcript_11008/g.25697  ORF Transcript_11008/g.25697 Transcript_11008/m.25697 type:complete len:86 (+) Transcript_11008:254-511(+)